MGGDLSTALTVITSLQEIRKALKMPQCCWTERNQKHVMYGLYGLSQDGILGGEDVHCGSWRTVGEDWWGPDLMQLSAFRSWRSESVWIKTSPQQQQQEKILLYLEVPGEIKLSQSKKKKIVWSEELRMVELSPIKEKSERNQASYREWGCQTERHW